MKLYLMLDFYVLDLVLAVLLIHILLSLALRFILHLCLLFACKGLTFLVLLSLRFLRSSLPYQWRTIVHHDFADEMRTMQSYVQVYLIVERDVCKDRKNLAR